MEITSLEQYKGTTFEVGIDGEKKLYLHIDIITDFGLAKGMQLERQELRRIIYASNFRRAYQYALYCFDRRDYSAEEIFERLTEKYKNEELCLEVVKRLARAGIVDDRRYAEKMARRYVECKRYGYRRARTEMLRKGLDEDAVEAALECYGEVFSENLAALVEKKYNSTLAGSCDKKSIEKVKAALVRYGYGYDEINRSLKEKLQEENETS